MSVHSCETLFVKGGSKTASPKDVSSEAGSSGAMEIPSEDYEVVYVKENVSVHPTQNANGRIRGRLRLVKQGPSLFMVGSSSHLHQIVFAFMLMFS
jgi:hypothetical protein